MGQEMHLLSLIIVSMSFQAWHFHVAAHQGGHKGTRGTYLESECPDEI